MSPLNPSPASPFPQALPCCPHVPHPLLLLFCLLDMVNVQLSLRSLFTDNERCSNEYLPLYVVGVLITPKTELTMCLGFVCVCVCVYGVYVCVGRVG